MSRDHLREPDYNFRVLPPKVSVYATIAWFLGVACFAPIQHWWPLMAIALLSAIPTTEWRGRGWLVPLIGIASGGVYLWRSGDVKRVVLAALLVVAYSVLGVIQRQAVSARRGTPPPSP